MISKRELSGRRELKTIASVFDTVKCQRDKALECLEWFWFHEDATDMLDMVLTASGETVSGMEKAYDEIHETYIDSWQNFIRLSEEIRKEMEGEL